MYGVKRTNHITPEESAKLSSYVNTLPQQSTKVTTYNPLNVVVVGGRVYGGNFPIFESRSSTISDLSAAKILTSMRK